MKKVVISQPHPEYYPKIVYADWQDSTGRLTLDGSRAQTFRLHEALDLLLGRPDLEERSFRLTFVP